MEFKNQDLLDRTKRFAAVIVKMTGHFPKKEAAAWKLAEQISDSAMSIHANLREAQSSRSRAEFISINSIALKEANETVGWLELLEELDWIKKVLTFCLWYNVEYKNQKILSNDIKINSWV